MASYTIEIDGQRFAGETAPARDQFEALHIVSSTAMIIAVEKELSDKGTAMSLMSLSWDNLQKLERLLIRDNIKREDDGVPVANNLFHDDPAAYALLIAKAIRANLSDSFTRLRGEEKNAKPAQQTAA